MSNTIDEQFKRWCETLDKVVKMERCKCCVCTNCLYDKCREKECAECKQREERTFCHITRRRGKPCKYRSSRAW